MLRTKEQLAQRQGKYGTPRFDYLQKLVTEFQETENEGSKEQILAHLGNFAYDPINYEAIRELHIIELFIDSMDEPNPNFRRFAVCGICNLSCDPANIPTIHENGGIQGLINNLTSADEETVESSILALIYLDTPQTRAEIMTPPVVELMRKFADSTTRPKLANLAKVFLEAETHHRNWRGR